MELTNLKRKLVTAVRGHKLLKDKRDELMRQFLELVQENRRLRERVEEGIASANKNFVLAMAVMQDETLKTAFLAPKQEVYLDTGEKRSEERRVGKECRLRFALHHGVQRHAQVHTRARE